MSFIFFYDEKLPAFRVSAEKENKTHRRVQVSAHHDGLVHIYFDEYGVEMNEKAAREFYKCLTDALLRANVEV